MQQNRNFVFYNFSSGEKVLKRRKEQHEEAERQIATQTPIPGSTPFPSQALSSADLTLHCSVNRPPLHIPLSQKAQP